MRKTGSILALTPTTSVEIEKFKRAAIVAIKVNGETVTWLSFAELKAITDWLESEED